MWLRQHGQVTATGSGPIKMNFLPKAGSDSSKSTLPHERSVLPIGWQKLSQSSSWLVKRWGADEGGGGVWGCSGLNGANHRQKNSITHHIRHHLTTLSPPFSSFCLSRSLALSPGVQPADSVGSICTFT